MESAIGYQWLAQEYGVKAVQPLPTISRLGKSRHTLQSGGQITQTFLPQSAPDNTLAGHLAFALKHEGVNLEFLARLFSQVPASSLEAMIRSAPSGQYARRAGFLYEWLTQKQLDFDGVEIGNYVDALPAASYLTASSSLNDLRWRVRDNLPGTSDYCPTIRRTEAVRTWEEYNCADRLAELETQYGTDILQRSAVWLTIRESRASFQIEHEAHQKDRVKRFAAAIEQYTGQFENPLAEDCLESLQEAILGPSALRIGLRRSPVFIGESTVLGEVVHYVGPHWEEDTSRLLSGLQLFERRTRNQSPLLRAAVLSFGFVYIHPMVDGNGRISRFLVNDTLRRDGAVPAPFILPISAAITRNVQNRAAYDHILEAFSKPFMRQFSNSYSFGDPVTADDGVTTNFTFSAYDKALPAWQYPDLTRQAEYLGQVIADTIETEMSAEAAMILDWRQTRERIKEVLEAPDQELDRIIRSIRESGGISNKLTKQFPPLADEKLAQAVELAVLSTDTPSN